MTSPIGVHELLDGATLRATFIAAAQHLRESARAVDAINVYPVPDGDTGSNMSATLREAVDRTLELGENPPVSEVLAVLARGALYGARGNSGVILSQALRGFASGVGEMERLDARGLADGLQAASMQAYKAVSNPQEGTMLTVLREAAAAAMETAGNMPERGVGAGCLVVMGHAVTAAEVAEAGTINQLESLREAGVTDAGGEGVCVILRGLFGALSGGMPEVRVAHIDRPVAKLAGHSEEAFGFCTEFLIESNGGTLDVGAVRRLAESGESRSVVVVGDESIVRIHAHTLEPQVLVDAAAGMGTVSRVKIEDMNAQNVRFRASGSGAGAKVGLLALSRGAGFDRVFESLGAGVSDLGVVEKPPAGEIAAAADSLHIPDVIVLPNHKNVLLAAEQARELAKCTLHVVPTVSLPQGVAAAMAFDPEAALAVALRAMREAIGTIRTVEVTTAGATRIADGVSVREGDAIVLVDGTLVAARASAKEALLAGLATVEIAAGALITIYTGDGIASGDLEAARAEIEAGYAGVEVEAVEGQQPLYQYIASIE